MTRKGIIIGLAVVAVAAAATVWYLQRERRPLPVFIIVVDTLRADRLSCYGYQGHDTPAIDALADRGVLFERAFSVGGWTVPSMGALMTSLYPTQLGLVEQPRPKQRYFKVRERREQRAYTVEERFTTLAEVFRDAGYHTAAFINQPVLNNHDGFIQGYEEWHHAVAADTILQRDPHGDESEYRHGIRADDVYRADSTLVEHFAAWLPGNVTGRMFVWLHMLTPHMPYRPPARYGVDADAAPSALYDGEVRYTDDMVSVVLGAIDAEVGLDRAIVVFTSDHGEEFGEHGSVDHGHSLHRECMHVPLIVSVPGVASERVAASVPLVDVFPTLADLCGVEVPEGVEGSSLAPLFSGGGSDRTVYSEGMLYGSTERSLTEGPRRLLYDEPEGTWRLFDLEADWNEQKDVAPAHPDETESMRERLVALHERLASDFVRIARDYTAADSAAAARERERALKAMRSLGYVND